MQTRSGIPEATPAGAIAGAGPAPTTPRGVVAVAVFLLLGTGIAALTSFSLLRPGTALDRLWDLNRTAYLRFASLGRLAGFLLLVVGCVTAAAGVGLLRRRRWGWLLAVGIFSTNVIGDVVRLVGGDLLEGAAGLLIGGAFLLYLTLPGVRNHFRALP